MIGKVRIHSSQFEDRATVDYGDVYLEFTDSGIVAKLVNCEKFQLSEVRKLLRGRAQSVRRSDDKMDIVSEGKVMFRAAKTQEAPADLDLARWLADNLTIGEQLF